MARQSLAPCDQQGWQQLPGPAACVTMAEATWPSFKAAVMPRQQLPFRPVLVAALGVVLKVQPATSLSVIL